MSRKYDELKAVLFVVLLFSISVVLSQQVWADEVVADPLTTLKNNTVSFFMPLEVKVGSVKDNRVVLDAGLKDGLKVGLRLRVFRKGEPFLHPVTKEVIGSIEEPVGVVEVTGTGDHVSECRVISGKPAAGDIARVSASKVRLLFYQDETVDYYLGDAYYKELKRTKRFELVDAPIEKMDVKQLKRLAEKGSAGVILILSSSDAGNETVLHQKLLWSDGRVISEDSVSIPEEYMATLKTGLEFLSGMEEEPLLTYELPFGAELVGSGDLDGDGRREILLSTGEGLYVYSYDVDLTYLYELSGKSNETVIWFDVYDIDGDGTDEVILVSITGDMGGDASSDESVTIATVPDEVKSYIYKVKKGRFVQLWKTKGFLRVLDGKLLYQKYSGVDIFSGPVREVSTTGGFRIGKVFKGVEGVGIYDFAVAAVEQGKKVYFVMDKDDRLNLYEDGVAIWRDVESMGGYIREYRLASYSIMVESGKWHINDRMTRWKNQVLVVRRVPLVKRAKTIGYKSSQLLSCRYDGGIVKETVLVNDIPGKLLDYTVFDNKIAVVSKPALGFKAGNILKGRNPFVKVLQIYSLKGI